MLWDPVSAREEAAVDREVADQLIPALEFDQWIANQVGLDHQVDAVLTSIEWAVPLRIAVLALAKAEVRAKLRHPATFGSTIRRDC
jgi:RNA 3'-terminal phosphate cyclase